MQSFEINTSGHLVALSVARKELTSGVQLTATATIKACVDLKALDPLGYPEEVDDDGVVVSSMGNEKPSDVWRRMFDEDGVPLPLGVKDLSFQSKFEAHSLALAKSRSLKSNEAWEVRWPNTTLDGFKAVPWPGPNMLLTFKAKFIVDSEEVGYLARRLASNGLAVRVDGEQSEFWPTGNLT